MDFTLNNMTLLALTLAVGIVIDDAIVVLENIVRYLEEKRYEPRAAAIEATKEITLAVLATTLSLVIIFLPIAFMSGYARRYVNQFGWTMAFSILVSMLVSFTLTPMLSSRLLRSVRAERPAAHEDEGVALLRLGRRPQVRPHPALGARPPAAVVADRRSARSSSPFPLNCLVGRDWIPPDDQGELTALLNLPEGTSLDATARVATDCRRKIARLKGVEFVNPYVHEGRWHEPLPHLREAGGPGASASFSNLDAAAEVRKLCAPYPNLRYTGHDPVRPRAAARRSSPSARSSWAPTSTRGGRARQGCGGARPDDSAACWTWTPA